MHNSTVERPHGAQLTTFSCCTRATQLRHAGFKSVFLLRHPLDLLQRAMLSGLSRWPEREDKQPARKRI